MNPTPYLVFQGNCRDAMTAYAEIFGGEVAMMMTGADMPEIPVPDDKAQWIMHSELRVGDGAIMASDDMMGDNPAMGGCWVMMEMPSTEAARTAFDALADGGEVGMPFGPTQWAEGFGMLTDKFGARWMISSPS